MNIIFFGTGEYTIPIVEVLKKHGLSLVVTTESEARSPSLRSGVSGRGKFIEYLKKEGVNFIVSDLKDQETVDQIGEIKPDIGILASYGTIISNEVIKLFPLGILNIHPSLLPKYRGPSPVQTAILNGDEKTGVTIIRLDTGIDHGPILLQVEEPILEQDTAKTLYEKLFKKSSKLTSSIVRTIELNKHLREKTQDDSRATFTKKITRSDGHIDIENPPSKEIVKRMIHAYYPWPGAWTEFNLQGKKLRIKLLPENRIQVEGKGVMKFADFLNGYKSEGQLFLSKLGFSDFS